MFRDNPEAQQVLREIPELSYIAIRDGRIVDEQRAQVNLFSGEPWPAWNRRDPTLRYLADYAAHHSDFGGEFFITYYDGWREFSEPEVPSKRIYVPWNSLDKARYAGKGKCGEPRFRHDETATAIYPELPLKVLTYGRHVDDRNCLLIPDSDFLSGFDTFLADVSAHDVSWTDKQDKIVWRGSEGNASAPVKLYNHGFGVKHQRHTAVEFSAMPAYRDILDASFVRTSIAEQLTSRYQLDIDGMVNAWSALFWKMRSNSLVIKAASHWEEWYYDVIKPYIHYVPLDSFHKTRTVIDWCRANEGRCLDMVRAAQDVTRRLTYDYAVREYTIH